MKRAFLVLAAFAAMMTAYAYEFEYSFKDTPLSQALVRIIREHPQAKVNFIYNELEGYKTNTTVRTDDAAEAIRQLVRYNPVSVVEDEGNIFVEALQKGRYNYTGRIIDTHGETVPFASVKLLSPRDSSVITYGVADTEGRFSIPCDKRGLIGKFSGVGYDVMYLRSEGFDFGDVTLPANSIVLKGVTVEASNASVTSDRSVYVPTNRQKRASQNGTDLLRAMAIPELHIEPGSGGVTDNTGNSVALFINHMPASADDIQAMKTTDVRRVEYLFSSTDPRFRGERLVVNFVVAEYEYGGYTKASVKENFLTGLESDASLFSKFSYKKMTYDLYAGARNQDDRHNGSSTVATYALKDEQDNPFTATRTEVMDDSRYKQNQYPVTLRASYGTKKVQIRNTVGFSLLIRPENTQSGSLAYYPSLGSDYRYSRLSNRRSMSLSYSGSFFFVLPRDFSLNIAPTFSYTRNRDNSDYTTTLAEPVLRHAFETANRFRVDAFLSKSINRNNTVSLRGFYVRSNNNVDYIGTNNSHSNYDHYGALGGVRYTYSSKKLSINADAGVLWERTIIDGLRNDDAYPSAHIQAGWSPNRKNRLSLFGQFASFTPELSEKTPDVLKQNELMYATGNPNLKNYRVYELSLGYTWIPVKNFGANIYARYEGYHNRLKTVYSEYDGGRAVLRSYINNGNSNKVLAGISFNWGLLDRNLMLAASPQWEYYSVTGINSCHLGAISFNASASYYLGDFYFEARYKHRVKKLDVSTRVVERGRNQYSLVAGWGNGKLNFRLTASNMFNKGWLRYTRDFSSPVYSESRSVFAPTCHPVINISVLYTISYGKKVKRGNEVGEQSGASSAILQ